MSNDEKSRAGQNRAEQSTNKQSRAEQGRAGQKLGRVTVTIMHASEGLEKIVQLSACTLYNAPTTEVTSAI